MPQFKSVLEAKSPSWVAVGNIFRLAQFLAHFPTVKNIIKNQHTGPHSAFSYVVTIANCVLWTYYGVSLDPKNKALISYINGAGALLHSAYLYIHYMHAPQKEKGWVVLMKVASLTMLGIIIVSAIVLVPAKNRVTVVGWICGILNIVMNAAPLSTLKQVVTTNDVTSIPFLVAFLNLLNSALWLGYSALHKDAKSTRIPNGLATVFGVIQLLLNLLYDAEKGGSGNSGGGSGGSSQPMARMEHMQPSP